MTFNTVTPNASQSPRLFPPQNNTNFIRLQQMIENDHQFNNTRPIPSPGNDGCHLKVSYINRVSPTGALPVGVNLISHTKNASDNVADLWAYDGTNPAYQYSWRELFGTVVLLTGSFTNVLPNPFELPTNSYGTISFLFPVNAGIGLTYQTYTFISETTTFASSLVVKSNSPTTTTVPISLAEVLIQPTSGLILSAKSRMQNNSTWQYKIDYRKYA